MFAKGEEVLAKHPRSKDYEKSKIVEIRKDNYKIRFTDGEFTVPVDHVKVTRPSRSATRSKSGKSPTRASPSRKKSPGRPSKTRSPARSPGKNRKTKSPAIETKTAKISIQRIDSDRDYADETSTTDATESLEGSDVVPLRSRLKELRPTGLRRSTRLQVSSPKTENRASSLPLERKFFKDDKGRGYSVQGDREKDEESESSSEKRRFEISSLSKPQEFGGRIGAFLLIIFLPLSILLPQLACNKNRCKSIHFQIAKDWRAYFNLNAFYAYAGFIAFVAIISMIPIGVCRDSLQGKLGRMRYRINAWLVAIISLAVYVASVYKGYKVSNFILDNILQLTVCAGIYSTLLAVMLYIKARKAPIVNQNAYGSTNSVIYNFWVGKEINPRIGSMDIKIVLQRILIIGVLLIDAAIVTRMFEKSSFLVWNNINHVLLISILMQALCVLDYILCEAQLLTTFEITQEGTGFMLCARYMMYPFVATLPSRYLLYNNVPLNLYVVTPCVLGFTIGYFISRISNNQKDTFRTNPFSPKVASFQTISTSRGKKLLVSGMWGYVRHPNYLGDIILQWSAVLIAQTTDVLPLSVAIISTISLIIRIFRNEARCKARYNVAWNEYCSRVKYALIKKIF